MYLLLTLYCPKHFRGQKRMLKGEASAKKKKKTQHEKDVRFFIVSKGDEKFNIFNDRISMEL